MTDLINSAFDWFVKMLYLDSGDPSNPCFTGEHNCDPTTALCEPVEGTASQFQCRCRPGYAGDGSVCDDVNECVFDSVPCPENSVCHNSAGSYSCTCREGMEMNERGECEAIGETYMILDSRFFLFLCRSVT